MKFFGVVADPEWDPTMALNQWEFLNAMLSPPKLKEYRVWGGDIGVRANWTDSFNKPFTAVSIESGYDHLVSYGLEQVWETPFN